MPPTKQQIRAKARAIVESINGMGAKEREKRPSAAFAGDYNELRSLAIAVEPTIEPVAPPAAEISDTEYGGKFVAQLYPELGTFANQIFHLLE